MTTVLQSLSDSFKAAGLWLLGRRQLLLVLMFGLLHLRIAGFLPGELSRVPLLMHFALFLLWQPFVSARSKITPPHLVWILIGGMVALFGMNLALTAVWLILLAGIVGGRVFFFSQRKTKYFYLFALSYLIVMLLLQVMPQLVPGTIESESLVVSIARYGAPVLIAIMALLPESPEKEGAREAIDLVYSVFIMLLLGVLVLGSAALMSLQRVSYAQALLSMVFLMAGLLLAASWLWNPVAGISRLGAITSRYMLSIGLPFEQWLRSLAELAQREPDPDRFLDAACEGMVQQLPWVSSCTWSDGNPIDDQTPASHNGQQTVFRQGELALTLTTQQAMAPVMVWHFNLVAQLVARFHADKKRDRRLREMAYMQAVHETGARVTHDVKNLLQSLNAMLYIIGDGDREPDGKLQPMLRRQLPLIAQRLQQTLEKLRVPGGSDDENVVAEAWWRELRARFEARGIRFDATADLKGPLPGGLFTNAAENLLQNALDKRAGEAGIEITISLDTSGAQPVLDVCDNGSPVPEGKAADVGQRPLTSENGLGIGLYQLARLAAVAGYQLNLRENRPGRVCFRLLPRAEA